MENKSIDLLSKLMAKENLTVIRQKVPTASFDLKNRILRLPMLINMSQIEETMMEFHEVGHALFTGQEYSKYIEDNKELKNFGSYMNILEDARIERILKDYYPGCRKDFYAGYKSLCERDFFGISGRNVNEMCLIDRINIFFKVGYSSGVRFSKEEREFVVAAEKTETLEDVYQLALRVYHFAAKQAKEEHKALTSSDDEFDFSFEDEEEDEDSDVGGYGEYGEDDEFEFKKDVEYTDSDDEGEDDEFEFKKDVEYTDSDDEGEDQSGDFAPKSETQDNFDENVQDNTRSPDGQEIVYIEPKNFVDPNFIGFREILQDLRANLPKSTDDSDLTDYWRHMKELYAKFRNSNNKAVSHLVKEFEMRKAAQRYSRSQVATTGSLSMNKIHKFKTSDDLFRKLDVVLDDKNHSFLMLLDWSGSMDANLMDSVGQIITLASFCRRVNIPFQVCAFSDNRYDAAVSDAKINVPTQFAYIDGDRINILNFLDSKMSNAEYEYMCEVLYTNALRQIPTREINQKYALGGTPLIEALCWLYGYIDTFKKNTRCEKMTVITVTDGEGAGVCIKSPEGQASMYRSQMFIRCPKTGRTYPAGDRVTIQNSIMAAIKNSNPDIRFVGFFVAGNKKTMYDFNRQNNHLTQAETILTSVRKNGYFMYPSPNYHKLFVIPAQNASVEWNMKDITEKMTAHQMARKLSSSMQSVIKGRVVLSKFIEEIS